MATPKEWQDNLERIQKIAGTYGKDQISLGESTTVEVSPKPEAKLKLLDALGEPNMDALGDLAIGLMLLLVVAPKDNHKEVIQGFLHGVVATLAKSIKEEADEQ